MRINEVRYTPEDVSALREMLALVCNEDRDSGVLTAGAIHADIPTIHDVSQHDGARLKVSGEVRHIGFGFFSAPVAGGTVNFDGGGAMRHADSFSWCPFVGPIYETGYDKRAVKAALLALLAAAPVEEAPAE